MIEENTYSKIKQDFYYRYSKYAIPALEGYEKNRKMVFAVALLIIVIIILLGLLFILTIFTSPETDNNNKYIGVVIILIFTIVTSSSAYGLIKKIFEIKIKKKIMPAICGCFHDLKWREPDISSTLIGKISEYFGFFVNFSRNEETLKYKSSNLITDFTRVEFDDCFTGSHNNVNYIIDELTALKETKDKDGNKTSSVVFKGVIITLDMNKKFNGNTVIRPDTMLHISPSKNLHHTVLEDVEFEKKFDVFTDDDIESRYLITPSLMERLKSMQVAFKADKISASFYQNKFYIALHTNKDLFSLGSLTKHICDKEQFFTMFEEILSIIKLIDHFKLDQKIGM